MSRCPQCPAADACIVDTTAHTTYCDWAKRGGMWRDKVAELSANPPVVAAPDTSDAAPPGTIRGCCGDVTASIYGGSDG